VAQIIGHPPDSQAMPAIAAPARSVPQTKQSFSGRCAWDNSLFSVFFLEPIDATFRIEDTLFSSEERMRRR
jgi:hypothetical protein